MELGSQVSHISEWTNTPVRSPSAQSSIISWPATLTQDPSEPRGGWGAQPQTRALSWTPPIMSPQPTPWTQQFGSPHPLLSPATMSPGTFQTSWQGIQAVRSQSSSVAPSTGPTRRRRRMARASSSAPVMRRRGEITAEEGDEDFLDQYRTLDTTSASFRFCARSYFLT
jgi:hypothetical protein